FSLCSEASTYKFYSLSLHDALPISLGQDHGLGGGRGGPAHAVGVLAVRIGAADHAQQQLVARLAGHAGALGQVVELEEHAFAGADRKSTRLNSSHVKISYAVLCLKK